MNNGVSKIPSDLGKILEDNTLPNVKNSREQFLEYTGERYVPEEKGKIELEHLHRYIFASHFVRGKNVLDIACGEGYGSNILSATASFVVGVDISKDIIIHAREKYKKTNIAFKQGSCDAIPITTSSIDVAVSFETIEHHDQHDVMIKEIKRVLKPSGVLIISSPNKSEYSAYPNPYHAKEIYPDEFKELIASHFNNISFYGQRVLYGSAIITDKISPFCTVQLPDDTIMHDFGLQKPLYLIAVASDSDIPPTQSSILEPPDNHIDALNQMIYERDIKLALITKSLTWRISKPLRFLERILLKKI